MKIAIIGTGRVGSVLALLLVNNPKIDQLLLINRTKETAEGLKMDLMGTHPKGGSSVIVGEYKNAKDADITFITCGKLGAPEGTSLLDLNKRAIEDVFKGWKPKESAKIVIITNPVDETALVAMKLSKLNPKNIIGFGGQLDVNRLEYLIRKDIGDFSKDVKRRFIGAHGARGIPVFMETVSDREAVSENAKNYYKKYLAGLKISTLGTSSELAKLFDVLIGEEEKVIDVSYYNEEHELFITWPCRVNKQGILGPTSIDLNMKEKSDLKGLIEKRKGD